MRRTAALAAISIILALTGCETIGVSRGEGGYAEVKPTVAHEMIIDSHQIVVLDFRPIEDYWGALGHIAGAISAPLSGIENHLEALLPYRDSTILVYADAEEESARGARILAAAGFANVVRIQGGVRAWIDLGYPTVSAD